MPSGFKGSVSRARGCSDVYVKKELAAYLAILVSLCAPPLAARGQEVGDGESCLMQSPSFKYNFLDSLLSKSPRSSDEDFLRKAAIPIDSVKEQVYLWYAYGNGRVADKFVSRADLSRLLDRGDDAINAMLWLLSPSKADDKANGTWSKDVLSRLERWRVEYRDKDEGRSMVLDLMKGRATYEDLSRMPVPRDVVDVDVLLQEGIVHEDAGKRLDALSLYTQVADYGYQKGLIGAALLLPQVGGLACVQRAKYYVMISGVTGAVTWWTPPLPSNESGKTDAK